MIKLILKLFRRRKPRTWRKLQVEYRTRPYRVPPLAGYCELSTPSSPKPPSPISSTSQCPNDSNVNAKEAIGTSGRFENLSASGDSPSHREA